MPGRIEFEFSTRSKGARGPHSESSPMRLLVLGDFSGRGLNSGSPDQPALSQRKLHPVDLDNLDQVLGRIAPEITLSLDERLATRITFSAIDDFHPDALFQRVPLFDELRDIRTRLHHRDTYPEAAAQLRTMLSLQAPAAPAGELAPPVVDAEGAENDAATLERLMGRPASGATPAGNTARSAVDRLIGAAVREHIVPEADASQQVYFDAVDQALGDLMRQVLHHPGFQALEALWRSVAFLISRLELDEDLQLVLLDVTKDELKEDARQAGNELEQTELYRLLIEQGVQVAGTDPWSLIVGQYCFDNSEDDTPAAGCARQHCRTRRWPVPRPGRCHPPRLQFTDRDPRTRVTGPLWIAMAGSAGTRCAPARLRHGSAWRYHACCCACHTERIPTRSTASHFRRSRTCPSASDFCGAIRRLAARP